jgi:hypothetical protein
MSTPLPKFEGWVRSSIGPSVPGSQIFICLQPANAPTPLTQKVPTPSPLANIFSDVNGLVPITQPMITDGFGYYSCYVPSGSYTILVYLNGILQKLYADEVPMGGAISGSGIVTTINGLSGDVILAGAGGISVAAAGNTLTLSNSRTASINYTIDGGGSVPSTGAKGQLNIPVSCTITGWVITADQSGSAVVDVLRSTYANFPTTASIAGTDKPTLSSVQKNEDLTLTGWGSTALSAGDQVQFNLNSVVTCTRLNISLVVTIP